MLGEVEQQSLLSALQSIPDVIWSASAVENRLLYVSPACEKMFGYTAEEILENQNLWNDIVAEDDRSKRKVAFKQLTDQNITIETIYKVKTRLGELKWVKDTLIPVLDDIDQLIRVDGIIRDITDTIETEHKFKKIFNLSSNLMFFIDVKNGDFIFENVNHKFRDLLKLNSSDITSHKLEEFENNSFINSILVNCKICRDENREVRFEVTHSNNNQNRVFLISLSPFYNSRASIFKIIGTGEDITDLKNTENRLQKLNEDKNRLLSIVSHDLKAPFNTMLGFIELLSTGIDLEENEKSEYLKFLYESSKRQIELINDLLDWSKVESGLLEFNPKYHSLKKIIEKILASYKGQAFQKKIEFEFNFDKDLQIFFDKNYSKVLLSNLISNAIKFSHKESKIIISAKTEGKFTRISIQDFGIGISERYLQNLFNAKSNYSTRGTAGEKGTGIGLKLCYDILTNNHGELTIDSEPNKGTTVNLFFANPLINIIYFDESPHNEAIRTLANSLLPDIYLCITTDIFEISKFVEKHPTKLAILNLDILKNFQQAFLYKIFSDYNESTIAIIGIAKKPNDDFQNLRKIIPINSIIPFPLDTTYLKEKLFEFIQSPF